MISLGDIYDKNVNFLVGSGASHGLFPTLELGLRKDNEQSWSLEDLAVLLHESHDPRYIPLFMHYYSSCIRPAQALEIKSVSSEAGQKVVENYRTFLETILHMLHRRPLMSRRCNVFTTNYDGCIPLVADEILRSGANEFLLNDGARGFRRRILHARNFNTFLCQTGVFERHQSSVPQINLIHLHGSVYWRKIEDGIEVKYDAAPDEDLMLPAELASLHPFSSALASSEMTLEDLECPEIDPARLDAFWTDYKKIPVVNPTKWKFHETVYEEHYYQMLRLLSYELEKPNAVLITFGFSFRDEHILNLVKRSLASPHLQVFICCFDKSVHEKLSELFRQHPNVQCIALEDYAAMDFQMFNSKVLTVASDKPKSTPGEPPSTPTSSAASAEVEAASSNG